MKRYKRVYKVYACGETCFTTRLRDVFAFVARLLLSNCERGFYRIEFEVVRYE